MFLRTPHKITSDFSTVNETKNKNHKTKTNKKKVKTEVLHLSHKLITSYKTKQQKQNRQKIVYLQNKYLRK